MKTFLTKHGFTMGPMSVERRTFDDGPKERAFLHIIVNGRVFQLHVSPKGRSVRFFSGGEEWKPVKKGGDECEP